MAARTTNLKRVAESMEISIDLTDAQLGAAVPTSGVAVVSPSGLTLGTVSPTATGVTVLVSVGVSGDGYTITATVTLSDGRTAVGLADVQVLDESLDVDPEISVWDTISTDISLTNRASVEDLLGEMNLALSVDDNQSNAIDPRERARVTRAVHVATAWVKRYCPTYELTDLVTSKFAWRCATVYAAREVVLRRGNPCTPGLFEMYIEALSDLKEIKNATMFIEDIGALVDPQPSWSNLRLDPVYSVKQLRVQKGSSDRSSAGFKRKQTSTLWMRMFNERTATNGKGSRREIGLDSFSKRRCGEAKNLHYRQRRGRVRRSWPGS